VGAAAVAALCKSLEHMGKSNSLEGAGAAVRDLAQKFERARVALARETKEETS
jgi:hypothetical protein